MFRRFVSIFVRLTAPLNEKLREDQQGSLDALDENESVVVAYITENLINPPELMVRKSKGHYTLDTDACEKKIKCVLLRQQENGSGRYVS